MRQNARKYTCLRVQKYAKMCANFQLVLFNFFDKKEIVKSIFTRVLASARQCECASAHLQLPIRNCLCAVANLPLP